jgi:bifunctional non-homologous end joining protein LigD
VSAKTREIKVGNRTIEVSRPDKVLFPDDGVTKHELVEYYGRVAETALPLWCDRPLSMHRYPDGIGAEGFFQKDVPDHFPDWIERVELPKQDGSVEYVLGNNAATLAYIAEQGCITPHIGLSRIDRIDCPDRMIFDLDPSDDDFGKVQYAARRIREIMDRLEVTTFVQATGSRGLHVIIPLDRSEPFDAVRDIAGAIADRLAGDWPDDLTVEHRKANRGDRVFLDYLRNAYGQTAVAPYGVRARPGAPVATPVDWDEALAADMRPRKYTIRNIFLRLGRKQDPWRDMGRHGVSARKLGERLEKA